MTISDQLAAVRDDLAHLHRQQSDAERADLDGRVTDRAAHRQAVDRRAEEIRRLRRLEAQLEREYAQQDEDVAA